jgi:hypothetical protein
MKELLRLLVSFGVLMVGSVSGVLAEDSVEGVWQVSRIDRDFRADPNLNPEPNMFIFTEKHYSIVVTFTDSAMRAYSKRWVPTDDEILKRFREVVVNSGTYKIEGSELRTYPMAARDPEFIGGVAIYRVSWSNEDLVLTYMDEYSFDDVQHPTVETSGGRLHLTLTRISE